MSRSSVDAVHMSDVMRLASVDSAQSWSTACNDIFAWKRKMTVKIRIHTVESFDADGEGMVLLGRRYRLYLPLNFTMYLHAS